MVREIERERVIVTTGTEPDIATAITTVIYVLLEIIGLVLLLRLILRLFGANPNNTFANLVYSLSDVFMIPFRGIFPTTSLEGFVFDWSVLVAMIAYAIVGYLVILLFSSLAPKS